MTEEVGHILVVDDNRLNRLKLSRGLEQQGHTVALAEDGVQALDMLHQQDYDVVLLDIMMPKMDGYEVLSRMKQDAELRMIPVIIISALDELDSAVRCIEMGAEDYLPKTFNPVFLRARIDASLRRKKLRDLEQAYLQQEVMLRQSEKLATLGKLSAGMAHELNNPAAAAQRGVEQLHEAFSMHIDAQRALNDSNLSTEQALALHERFLAIWTREDRVNLLDPLARSDLEYELEQWLEERQIEQAWQLTAPLVAMDYDIHSLNALTEHFQPAQLGKVLVWLVTAYTIISLLEEIGEGTRRISDIVGALKTYTYLDQAPVQNINVHEGLDNTLVMFRNRLRQGIVVHREYAEDLPSIEAFASELNQVWTNLIDNAIDAMEGQGEITIRTRQNGHRVIVEIADNGAGIPPDVVPNIFDPFFTTKAVGEGSGLGLNISHNIITQKHKGEISVRSKPGETCFQIALPLRISED